MRDYSSVSRLRKMVVLCVRRMTLVHSLPSKTPHRSRNVFTFVGTVAKRKKCGRLLRIAPWSLNVSCTRYMFSGIAAFNGYTRNRGMIYCNASQSYHMMCWNIYVAMDLLYEDLQTGMFGNVQGSAWRPVLFVVLGGRGWTTCLLCDGPILGSLF